MRKQQFQVGDRQIRCVPEPEHVVRAGLKRARHIELPARTEVIVPIVNVLKDLIWNVCLIYLHNIIVYGTGFYSALDQLKMVWRCIREVNLKLKPMKLCLMRVQVPLLGHIVSCQGVGVDPQRLKLRNSDQYQSTSRTCEPF